MKEEKNKLKKEGDMFMEATQTGNKGLKVKRHEVELCYTNHVY